MFTASETTYIRTNPQQPPGYLARMIFQSRAGTKPSDLDILEATIAVQALRISDPLAEFQAELTARGLVLGNSPSYEIEIR